MKRIIQLAAIMMMFAVSLLAQDRDQTRLQEHLMMQDGKMYQIKDQEQIQLQEQFKLKNGGIVNPDGSFQLQNQKQMRLKNGECLDMEGKRYESQDRFRDKMMKRNMDRSDKENMKGKMGTGKGKKNN